MRWKITLLYSGTVVILFLIFIGAEVAAIARHLVLESPLDHPPKAVLASAIRQALMDRGPLLAALIIVIFLVGYAFIVRALKPVRDMTRIAKNITADDLSQRIDSRGDAYEIGELAHTLNGMIERLEGSFSNLRRFSGDAAHELNTPLTVLKGEIEIALRKERSPLEYRETLERLLKQVSNLARIIDDLLLLSRADAGVLKREAKEVDLSEAALAAFEEVAPLARNLKVSLDIDHLDETIFRGDLRLLRRLIVNLLQNGVKFTPSGGRVTLSLQNREGGSLLTVSDTGIGIPARHLPHLFERFYRVDPSRAKLAGGAGLGLSIVRKIAEEHDLEVTIHSREGEGTRVEVFVPSSP